MKMKFKDFEKFIEENLFSVKVWKEGKRTIAYFLNLLKPLKIDGAEAYILSIDSERKHGKIAITFFDKNEKILRDFRIRVKKKDFENLISLIESRKQ